jgi:subtilisin family serine protease
MKPQDPAGALPLASHGLHEVAHARRRQSEHEGTSGTGAASPGLPGEQDAVVTIQALSDDALYVGGSLWGMYGDASGPRNAFGSQAAEAWNDGFVGSTRIVVGVVDTGITYTHPDLYLNVWLNQGEIPADLRAALRDVDADGLITFRDLNQRANAGLASDINRNGRIDAGDLLNDRRWENGKDEDRNGYRDDLVGWDFVGNDNDPMDDNGHGTHVSATIGGMGGNGIGVAGVAWDVQIIALKFLGRGGTGQILQAAKAVDYFTAAAQRAEGQDFVATNNSWGGGGYSAQMQAAIDRAAAADILFVAAAGNGATNTDIRANFPSTYSTQASVGHEAVISVAAIGSMGELAAFSNFGAATVDIGAPGVQVQSALPGGGYGVMSGTSMATPHVTGALALYMAAHPEADTAEARDALLSSAIPTASLAGRTATGGRLDADAMLAVDAEHAVATGRPTGVTIYGVAGADTVAGTRGDDTISAVPQAGPSPGRGVIDALIGGAGNDVFVLGDARGAFYYAGQATRSGASDYARIIDYQAGDRIQLSNEVAAWFQEPLTIGGVAGLGIYADSNRDGQFNPTDDLVAHVLYAVAPCDLYFV